MVTVSLDEIKQDLSGYLLRVEAGETLLVLKEGKVIAEIKPAVGESGVGRPRPYGLCAGNFTVPDDFDEPLPEEILRGYEGS
jgi:antitoxin (DNA-binding transcriptional repressor) of toxin-antitoxin stability system